MWAYIKILCLTLAGKVDICLLYTSFVLATIGANIATALFTFFYSNSYKYLSINDWDKEARCV